MGSMSPQADPDQYLAAGPWCFYRHYDNLTDCLAKFQIAPDPLADRSLLPTAIRAAQTLALQLLPKARTLLAPTDSHLPMKYWQILLMPWLVNLSSQVVERALRCKAMLEKWGHLELLVPLIEPGAHFAFADEQDFTLRGAMGLEYNHWLFSWLLLQKWPRHWEKKFIRLPDINHLPKTPGSLKKSIQKLLLKLPFPRQKGLPLTRSLQFSLLLASRSYSGPDQSIDLLQEFQYEADLERIMGADFDLTPVLQVSLPASFLNLEHRDVKNVKKPHLRIAALSAAEDVHYRQKLARFRAAGDFLAYIQHGGNYGVVKYPCAAELTEYCQQVFYTWGWRTQGEAKGNFKPVPSFQLCKQAHIWKAAGDAPMIFVGTEMPIFSHRLDCHPTPVQYIAYRESKKNFLASLKEEIFTATLYRPYFDLPNTWPDAKWLTAVFPKLKICRGPLMPQLAQCRLLVLDHHGTTMLEAMAANIPMILYWAPEAWPVTDEFMGLLEQMRKAGIWFSTPEAAARQANKIWQNIKEWHMSRDVRDARAAFMEKQILLSTAPCLAWHATLARELSCSI